MSLDLAILGFLAERPLSGYDLKTRCFSGAAGALWTADQAQIYRTLERLQAGKLVASARKRQQGRPDRRIFEITDEGRGRLDTLLAEPTPLSPTRDPFLLELYFSARLDDGSLLAVLEQRRTDHQERLLALREHSDALAGQHGVPAREAVLRQTALDGAMVQQRAAIDWLDDCVQAVRDGALPGSDQDGTGQRQLFGTSPA